MKSSFQQQYYSDSNETYFKNSKYRRFRTDERIFVDLNNPVEPYQQTVGQIQEKVGSLEYFGTGVLISYKGRCLLLTVPSNLIRPIDYNVNEYVAVDEAYFYLYQKDNYKSDKPSRIINFSLPPGRFNDPFCGYHIAIGLLDNETELYFKGQGNYRNWTFTECINPKVGETIVLIGFPDRSDKRRICYEQKGTISKILDCEYSEDSSLIMYRDIETKPGNSGSPVFLKRGDQFSLIGVHVGFGIENSIEYGFATAITLEHYRWIINQFETLK